MEEPAAGALSDPDGPYSDAGKRAARDRALRALRARWRTASLAAGWRFPRDWGLPEVDAVCAAVLGREGEIDPAGVPGPPMATPSPGHGGQPAALTALAGLGRARAAAGTGLEETLTDLAALHAVMDEPGAADGFVAPDVDAMPARLLRVTAVAWADVALDQLTRAEVSDPLTGLPTIAYLRTRLAELYREADRDGGKVSDNRVIVVVTMDFVNAPGWSRLTGMILAADALGTAFDGGESLAVLGPSTVAAVAQRDDDVAARALALRRELSQRLAVDAQLREVGTPRITMVRLPGTHEAACELLDRLSQH
ncbi:GGDEF domain-containing protein [Saccharomonospora sp. NPDC006951]